MRCVAGTLITWFKAMLKGMQMLEQAAGGGVEGVTDCYCSDGGGARRLERVDLCIVLTMNSWGVLGLS